MKKILFAATVLCMMGCQNKPTNSTPALDPSNMDTSVAPNESFYQYATGGWQAKNPLKPEHSSYNMFNVLSDNNEIRINELFTQMTKENPAKQCAIRIDKQQKERYNNIVIDNDVII